MGIFSFSWAGRIPIQGTGEADLKQDCTAVSADHWIPNMEKTPTDVHSATGFAASTYLAKRK